MGNSQLRLRSTASSVVVVVVVVAAAAAELRIVLRSIINLGWTVVDRLKL